MVVADYGAPEVVKPRINWKRMFLGTLLCISGIWTAAEIGGQTWQGGLTGAVVALFTVITVSNATSWKPVGWRWIVFSYPVSLIALLVTALPFSIPSMAFLTTPVDVSGLMASLGRERLIGAAIGVAEFFLARSKLVHTPALHDDD